ncbi:Uncharacterized protein APZ42_032009 [Daphnia magna]|uniref:Uncharacterized protein n=1 Tax=Daphnia magna TaxID=35525 RepID=A0A164MFT9_9CRUS|nr:Uncharacterized protein APZ42_032009 [Daphnia magna]
MTDAVRKPTVNAEREQFRYVSHFNPILVDLETWLQNHSNL